LLSALRPGVLETPTRARKCLTLLLERDPLHLLLRSLLPGRGKESRIPALSRHIRRCPIGVLNVLAVRPHRHLAADHPGFPDLIARKP
jgi:hypothetical protein